VTLSLYIVPAVLGMCNHIVGLLFRIENTVAKGLAEPSKVVPKVVLEYGSIDQKPNVPKGSLVREFLHFSSFSVSRAYC